MTLDLPAQKRELRRRLREALRSLTPEQQREGSLEACELLRRQEVWRAARTILFYAALPGELDLSPLLTEALAAGKTVALPGFAAATGAYEAFVVTDSVADCAPGKFGVVEPKPGCASLPLNRLDLVLTPGVGFDLAGRRLGRGQGFYDRLLAGAAGAKCGVAFDLQLAGHIPSESHDIQMNFILTPTQWRPCAALSQGEHA